MIVPLHNHTDASAKDGVAKVDDIIKRCKEIGVGACGCTDHDVVVNHPNFYRTLTKAGLKPLLGIEAYQAPVTRWQTPKKQRDDERNKVDLFHLILLAKNEEGLRNLWAMNTEAHKTGFWHNARVDWDLLKEYNKGLIATSACFASYLSQAIMGNTSLTLSPEKIVDMYLDIFGDNFYIELGTYSADDQHLLNIELATLATEKGVPLVYANDAHYAFPDQYDLHEVILCLKRNEKFKDQEEPHFLPDLYIMDEDDVRTHFSYLPNSVVDEALANSVEIANQCDAKIPDRKDHTVAFIPDRKFANSWDMFEYLAQQGFLAKKHLFVKSLGDYLERYEVEMEIMKRAKLYDYFLMLWDAITFARKHMTVGPGRGSVGGSLIAWLIGITSVDPLKYDLFFERFYNAGREKGLPDIDVDFPSYGRGKLVEYVKEKYGQDYVAEIGNTGDMQAKSAIQDFGRVLSLSPRDCKTMSDIIQLKAGLQPKWSEIDVKHKEELAPWEEKYPQLFQLARQSHGMVRQYGIHASGVVVADEPLSECLPLSSRKGENETERRLATQFDYRDVESFGFMKMDFLGLQTLDKLDETIRVLTELYKLVPPEEAKRITDWEWLQYQDHPEEMWQLLDKGLGVGLFQIEDGGTARQIAKQMKPRSVEDLAAILALNRPGVLQSRDKDGIKALDRYMHGRAGGEVTYVNDVMEKVTESEYGIFLYQEQIIRFMVEIGYTLTEADDVRKLMGKKLKEKLDEEYKRYLPLALNHMSKEDAQEIWDQISNFGEYGFNKSHAIQYGVILLGCAYAKYWYPQHFVLASMRVFSRQKSKKKENKQRILNDAHRMGISIAPPEINKSQQTMAIIDNGLVYGFADIKGVGAGPAKWLVQNQPFDGLDDLLEKQREKKMRLPNGTWKVAINAGQIGLLVKLGALGDCEFSYVDSKNNTVRCIPQEGEQLLALQEELLGLAVSDTSATILDDYEKLIDEQCTPLDAVEDLGDYFVAGIITDIKHGKTKHNKPYARVKIENSGSELEFPVWDSELKRLSFIWRLRQAGIFHVKVELQRSGQKNLRLLEGQALLPKRKSWYEQTGIREVSQAAAN